MAKVKAFRAGYGTSFQTGGQNGPWHKVTCEIEIEIEGNDNVEDVKRKAWNTVEAEVEKQVDEIIGAGQ